MERTMARQDAPDVSVLMVSYNTADMTVAAIRSLYETAADVNLELLVYDNASRDGSADRIAEAFPEQDYPSLTLVRLPENVGFAKANNLAARKARGTYLLLLNPDTVVLPGAIQGILAFARARPQARIWGARNVLGNGQLDPGSVWRRMSLWGVFCFAFGLQQAFPASPMFNPEGYGGWNRDTERDVDVVTGCFLLTETALWRALDGFDERFFMYAEEADFCLRARALGAQPRFTPDAEIIHYGGASETLRARQIAKIFAGKISLAHKHWPAWQVVLVRHLYRGAVLLRWIGYGILARAARDPRRSAAASGEWREVWHIRETWVHGHMTSAGPKAGL